MENCEILIESVRQRSILYDTSHEDYLKTKYKQLIWEEVAKEAGFLNGTKAKERWEKLRHSFRDALRRQQKKSGSAAESAKLWKFQRQMEFLQPFSSNKDREGNVGGAEDEMDTMPECTSPPDLDPESSEKVTEAKERVPTCVESLATGSKTKKDSISSLLKQTIEQHAERRLQRDEDRKRLLEESRAPKDPLYHFFMSMYESTRRLPHKSQRNIRNKLFNIVNEEEESIACDDAQ